MISGLIVCSVLLTAGCRKTNTVDKGAFKSAIDHYLSVHQECVWPSSVKFPAQITTSNDEETKGYDALTDAGLLRRGTAEKKRFLIGSKQVNLYDVSDKGRTAWTVDPAQPGYANFCFGHREVTTVDSYTPADNPNATQYVVGYHYDVASLPDWASNAEVKSAFPVVAADTSGQQSTTATLTKSSDGWQVAPAPLGDSAPINP
jgi:hypothetical protein